MKNWPEKRDRGIPASSTSKLDRGGIRDIEFLVQCLQRLYGGAEPWVRHGGTLLAIARLQDKGFLSDAEYGRPRLRLSVPAPSGTSPAIRRRSANARAALRSGRRSKRSPAACPPVVAPRMAAHRNKMPTSQQVIEIYERVVHARVGSVPETSGPQSSNVVRALEQTAPALSRSLAVSELHHGYRAFEHFLEKLSADEARLERLERRSGADRAHARFVRAKSLFCRGADPHAGAD